MAEELFKTKQTVVQIIQTLEIGGAENFVCQLSNELIKNNHITLITTKAYNSKLNFDSTLNKEIEHIKLNWKRKYSILQYIELLRLIKKIKPDVIHVHLHNSFYYVFAISLFNKKQTYIHTMHANVKVWNPILKFIHKLRFLNNSIVHVCISSSIYTQFKEIFPELNVAQINNGIASPLISRSDADINQFWLDVCNKQELSKSIKLIAIGNVSFYKNYSLLAEALEGIHEEFPEVICALIGRNDDIKEINKINKYIGKNLTLLGPHSNAFDYLSKADALLISSLEEGMPIVALEAMALGKPIITTPAGGMVDLVKDNFNGFVSENFTVDAYKKALRKYLVLDCSQKNKLKNNAISHFKENYEIEFIAKKYNRLYSN